MNNLYWFDDQPVIGALTAKKAAIKLNEIGESVLAKELETYQPQDAARSGISLFWPVNDKPWQHTSHAFGYLAPLTSGRGLRRIVEVGSMKADESLRGARIRITLNALKVANYPGSGIHHVLFDFYAQNQVREHVEHLHYNALYRVAENEHAAVRGYPIFVGLATGEDGVAFKCRTVNVKNESDQSFLSFLESDTFKTGLKLVSTAQPAIGLLSSMAYNITRTIAGRNQNVAVQDFDLGLDFGANAMGARLAVGSYIAVQVPKDLERQWTWNDWVFDPDSGLIVSRADNVRSLPYNYVVFGVSKYMGK